MRFKPLYFALTFICLILLMGCSDKNDTIETATLKPPDLTIHVGDETIKPVLGTYSWSIDNGDGTETGVDSDSDIAPELVKDIDPIHVTEDTNIELEFEKQPDNYTVNIWEDNDIASTSNDVDLSGHGEVIYEIVAHWQQGTGHYAFVLYIE